MLQKGYMNDKYILVKSSKKDFMKKWGVNYHVLKKINLLWYWKICENTTSVLCDLYGKIMNTKKTMLS